MLFAVFSIKAYVWFMDKRTLVIGDIHGGYKALEQVLNRARVTVEDKLIFLGDYVDGWSESKTVIDKLIALSKTHNCIFIRGNHDALFTEYLKTRKQNKLWLRHGGASTLKAYENCSPNTIKQHRHFLEHLQNYHIDDQNRLFLHAGFINMHGPEQEYYAYIFYWDRTLWETALATDKHLDERSLFYPKRFTHFKEIFIGHTPTIRIGETKPVQALNLWNVDTGAAFTGTLSALDVDTKQVYQSDEVWKLYPDEEGRNR